MVKVIFVCLGNICRSPMAHGIFREKVKKLSLNFHIESAGTSAFHIGEGADRRGIATLNSKGIDIKDLRSRLFTSSDFNDYDYIIAMDHQNLKDIQSLQPKLSNGTSVEMLMNYACPGEDISIPDPYYGGATGFEEVYKMLDLALDDFLKKLV